MERANFKNFIEVFNELSQAVVLERDSKKMIDKIQMLYDCIRGYLTEENRKRGDRLYEDIESGIQSRRAAMRLFRLIHGDRNVIKLKNFHAGYSELKAYDLTEAVEVLTKDEA